MGHVLLEPEPQFVGWQDYAQFLTTDDVKKLAFYVQCLTDLKPVSGDIVEIGAYRGGNLKMLAFAYACVEPDGRRNVLGFDTFEGFPQDQIEMPQEVAKKDVYSDGDNLMATVAKLTAVKRPARLVFGDVVETLPKFHENWQNRIALAYLDVDLREPSRVALDQQLSVGGRILLDQYCRDGWSETRAVDEFLAANGANYKLTRVPDTAEPTAYLEKLA